MSKSNWFGASLCVLIMLGGAGCMPDMSEKKIDKPRTTKEALGRWNSVRGTRGQSTKKKYMIEGEEFEALWEINRAIGGSCKLQLQLPKWEQVKVYQAVEIAFDQEPDQPWFYPIEDTFLPCVRRAMGQIGELQSEKTGRCLAVTPEMPYDCSVKVIERTSGWFVECTASLIPDYDPNAE